jgi:hypothetical protein
MSHGKKGVGKRVRRRQQKEDSVVAVMPLLLSWRRKDSHNVMWYVTGKVERDNVRYFNDLLLFCFCFTLVRNELNSKDRW